MISVIIPTYNEEAVIEQALRRLGPPDGAAEVLVADGASTDRTAALAAPHARVIPCERNRGAQLNRAAREARGDVLLFLHADTTLPPGGLAAIERALAVPEVVGGNFTLAFTGDGLPAKVFTRIDRWRRRFGIFYGDSGIFVRRAVFDCLGGFQPWPLLEDYEFARRLIKTGKTVCLPEVLSVSSRRWQRQGNRRRLFRTLAAWFFIQAFFFLRVPPRWLVRWYPPARMKPPAFNRSRLPFR